MPPRKSIKKFEELCWQTVLQDIYQFKRNINRLPSIFKTELFNRCYTEFYVNRRNNNTGFKFPAKLFIQASSEELAALDFFDLPKDEVITKIRETCTSLRKIKFSFPCKFLWIVRKNRNLIHLELLESRVTDKHLAAITKYCPQLKILVLTGCPKITDNGMQYLSKNITHLVLERTNITEKGCVVALNLLQSLKKLSHSEWIGVLRLLKIENCVKQYSIEKMDIYILVTQNFDFYKVATDLFPKLQKMNLHVKDSIYRNEPIMLHVHNINHKIIDLTLDVFPVNHIKIISYFFPMLEKLDINFSFNPIELQLEITTEQVLFKHLRKLSIGAMYLNLAKVDFLMMLENCPELEFFKITSYHQLSDEWINDLMIVNPMHQLKTLSFHNCDLITIESMITLLKSLPSLQEFGISLCEKISYEKCEILEELIQHNNWDVTLSKDCLN